MSQHHTTPDAPSGCHRSSSTWPARPTLSVTANPNLSCLLCLAAAAAALLLRCRMCGGASTAQTIRWMTGAQAAAAVWVRWRGRKTPVGRLQQLLATRARPQLRTTVKQICQAAAASPALQQQANLSPAASKPQSNNSLTPPLPTTMPNAPRPPALRDVVLALPPCSPHLHCPAAPLTPLPSSHVLPPASTPPSPCRTFLANREAAVDYLNTVDPLAHQHTALLPCCSPHPPVPLQDLPGQPRGCCRLPQHS